MTAKYDRIHKMLLLTIEENKGNWISYADLAEMVQSKVRVGVRGFGNVGVSRSDIPHMLRMLYVMQFERRQLKCGCSSYTQVKFT